MKETFPIILNDKMYIAVGSGSTEYIVGETILNPDSDNERSTWYRAARALVIGEFESICNFIVAEKITEAKELAELVSKFLTECDDEYPACVHRFKDRLKRI